MTLGLLLYRTASSFLGLFSGFLLKGRVHAGKEDVARLNERRARDLMRRPPGTLIWLHGASVGESLMLLELGVRLQDACPDLQLLFTSQTQTSARLLIERLPENARHQMAPLDTPAAARRFVSHWQPDLVIIAEGEIWPNLL
ncbi:MAG: glycosyltransferase N-terminal domain-containing protein, partial [Hyphomonadaceae bacterium]